MSREKPVSNGEEKADTRIKPGQVLNPAGRPKGSRNKLGEAFIQALHDDFKEHGVKAIQTVRQERPHEYLKVVASLQPKQIEIKEDAFGDLTDEQLAAVLASVTAALGIETAAGEGAGNTTH